MAFAQHGDCRLYFETFGDADRPALLLVNGLGSQCVNYDERWCQMFADTGLFVIRFDNRDVGLSSWFDDAPLDELGRAYEARALADDAIAVLDAAGVDRAHIHGVSMGGSVVQRMAILHPRRVKSMISVMSATGEADYTTPSNEAIAHLMAPPATSREGYVEEWIKGLRIWGSPVFADEARWRFEAERAFDRAYNPAGPGRQLAALVAGPPTAPDLGSVSAPTLVIHGTADTLIPPAGGRRTAQLIPGARFELIEGMGHDYPPGLWPLWTTLVVDFVNEVEAGERTNAFG